MKLKNLLLIACLMSSVNVVFGINLIVSDTIPQEDSIYKSANEMPLFAADCEVKEYLERKACADKKMLEFIYMNITYPYEARINGVEGTVVVSFVVEKDGKVTNIKILRNPGSGLGEDVVRVITEMPNDWTPAIIDGKPVRFKYALPIKYRLETPEETRKYNEEQREKKNSKQK